MTDKTQRLLIIVALVLGIVALGGSVVANLPLGDGDVTISSDDLVALGTTHFTNVSAEDLTSTDDVTVGDDLTVTGAAALNGGLTMDTNKFIVADTSGNTTIAGTLTVSGVTTVPIDTEHIGLPTIDAATITYTTSGALWTVGASEVWFIHAVLCNITTNFDCTGSDCTLHIGDGEDEDGFLDLDDAEMQAADTECTGCPAGWQGFASTDTRGAFFTAALPFVETNDTIDITIAGTDPAAGAATCYIVYTRMQ